MKNISKSFIILFLYLSVIHAQQITSVDPGWVCKGKNLTVSITGQNTYFTQATGTIDVSFSMSFSEGTITTIVLGSVSTVIVSDTNLIADFNISENVRADTYDVVINKDDREILSLNNGFVIHNNDPPETPNIFELPEKYFTNNSQPTLLFTVPIDFCDDLIHFKVEISNDENFGNNIFGGPFRSWESHEGFISNLPARQESDSCAFTIPYPLDDNTYYWRITAFDGKDSSNASATYSFTIDSTPPDGPTNLLANGENPSPLQKDDNVFEITWQNPYDVSGIAYYYYKLGAAPQHALDFSEKKEALSNTYPTLTVYTNNHTTKPECQTLYVWLEDGLKNADYKNSASIDLCNYYDTEAPLSPINILADSANPSNWKFMDSTFVITWKNPPDSSGILRCFYKFGTPPTSQNDAKDSVDINEPKIEIEAEKELGDTLYVWLMDKNKNVNYDKDHRSPVILNYYTELPDVKILEPKNSDYVSNPIHIEVSIAQYLKEHNFLFKTDSSDWVSCSPSLKNTLSDTLFYYNWKVEDLTKQNLWLKVSAYDKENPGNEKSDSVRFGFNLKPVPNISLTQPVNNSFVSGPIKITGTAIGKGEYFKGYKVRIVDENSKPKYSYSANEEKFDTLLVPYTLITDDFDEGSYELIFEAKNEMDGISYSKTIRHMFTIDQTPPQLIFHEPVTDTISCNVPIKFAIKEMNLHTIDLRYSDRYGKGLTSLPDLVPLDENSYQLNWDTILRSHLNGRYKFYLTVKDKAGLDTTYVKEYFINNPLYDDSLGLTKSFNNVSFYIPPKSYESACICIDRIDLSDSIQIAATNTPNDMIFRIQSTANDAVVFKHPAEFRINYRNYLDEISDENQLRLYYLNPAGKWELIGGTLEPENSEIYAGIKKIGVYGVFENINLFETPQLKDLEINCSPRVLSPKGGGFDTKTRIMVTLNEPKDVTIKIYNTAGRMIRLVADSKPMYYGENIEYWNGCDHSGSICPTGLYIVAVKANDKLATKTVVVMNK